MIIRSGGEVLAVQVDWARGHAAMPLVPAGDRLLPAHPIFLIRVEALPSEPSCLYCKPAAESDRMLGAEEAHRMTRCASVKVAVDHSRSFCAICSIIS